MKRSYRLISRNVLLATSLVVIGACSSSNDDLDTNGVDPDANEGDVDNTNTFIGSSDPSELAFVSSRSSDYGSYRFDRISLDDGNTVTGSFPAGDSDIAIAIDSGNLYEIGRFQADYLTRYDPLDTSVVDYQITLLDEGEEGTSNPQSVAFVDQTKAYVTRRSSDKMWIIDPDPATDADLKIGEIDLGAYDTAVPNMTDAIIVNDKLFVLLERLQEPENGNFKTAYLVVIDTSNDTEIETNQGSGDLKGIELLVRNPTSLEYNEETDEIYVVGRGSYYFNEAITVDTYSGGIEVIDPTTYENTLLIDDGTDDDNEGYFYEAEVISPDLGYLLTYVSFGVTTLRTFNPTTGVLLDTLIEGLQDVDITAIAEGPDNHLWVGINDATPGFFRIDLATGELAGERVSTELIPQDIVFMTVPAE